MSNKEKYHLIRPRMLRVGPTKWQSDPGDEECPLVQVLGPQCCRFPALHVHQTILGSFCSLIDDHVGVTTNVEGGGLTTRYVLPLVIRIQ